MTVPKTTSDAAWIRTAGLSRYYIRGPQEVRALDEVDLTISRGEFIAVVGSSGSGKSTLLNLLAGLDTPTAGRIFIAGEQLDSFSRKRLSRYRAQQIGMVFQSFNLISHKTALENVETALYFNETPKSDRQGLASQMLTRLGLGDRLHHRPADLSGGEQQRVAFARALVKNPQILFADEPTGNLDRENTELISQMLKSFNQSGVTVVMVTHDAELANSCANRIVSMDYGKIVSDTASESGIGEGE